jgi:hypothetical protein
MRRVADDVDFELSVTYRGAAWAALRLAAQAQRLGLKIEVVAGAEVVASSGSEAVVTVEANPYITPELSYEEATSALATVDTTARSLDLW